MFYCLNLLYILSLIHTPTNSERFYSWRSNGKKKGQIWDSKTWQRENLKLRDTKIILKQGFKTNQKRSWDSETKPYFSSYHSIPLTVHSFYPPAPTTPTVNTLFMYKKQCTKATTILHPEMFHPRGEGQTQQSIIRVVQSLNLLYTILDRKGTPFVYLPLTSLELCIPFSYCKGSLFKIWINHKPEHFSQLFSHP